MDSNYIHGGSESYIGVLDFTKNQFKKLIIIASRGNLRDIIVDPTTG